MQFVERDLLARPAILFSARARDAIGDIEQYLDFDDDKRLQRRAPFINNLVQNSEVSMALRDLFHGKCAYCETQLHGQVVIEHFRPRQFATGSEHDDEIHYAWLAYDWENLYPCCEECTLNKGTIFPVRGARARPWSSVEEARRTEVADLVDPCFDDPRSHLILNFDGDYSPLSFKGQTTIDVLGLNRESLFRRRREMQFELKVALERAGETGEFQEIRAAFDRRALFTGGAIQYLARFMTELTGARPRWPRSGGELPSLLRAIRAAEPAAINRAAEAARHTPERRRFYADLDVHADPSPIRAADHRRAGQASIRRVMIKNFKGLRKLELEIPGVRSDKGAGCLMLLGENAAGKSSVLEALALTLVGSRAASRLARPEDVLRESGETRFGAANTNLTVQVDFFRGAESAHLQMDPLEKRFVGDAHPVAVVIGYGPRRYTDPRGGPWGDSVGDRVRGLFAPAFPLPDATEWLRGLWRNDRERYYAVARALRVILALRDDDELEPDERMGFAVRAQGRLTPIHRMSEGYRSLFIMAVDIMRELLRHAPNLESARAVVLIDEIETHLHPRWKLRVMSSLRTAMPSVTFIATTHDPLCLRGMEDGEVVVLYKGDDQEVSKIDDLPSVTGMRAEQLLTSDYFGLDSTADPEIEDRLAEYVDALTLDASGRPGATADMAASLGHSLSESLVLGDTAADQVAQEALRRYLVERRKMPPPERSAARREVVERMLAVLRRPLGH